MIGFNVPPVTGNELKNIAKAIENHKICGDGEFTHKCSEWLKQQCDVNYSLLTTSCTAALEMSAILCDGIPRGWICFKSIQCADGACSCQSYFKAYKDFTEQG